MVIFSLYVFIIGIIAIFIGAILYSQHLKKTCDEDISETVENNGTPVNSGVNYIKIVHK